MAIKHWWRRPPALYPSGSLPKINVPLQDVSLQEKLDRIFDEYYFRKRRLQEDLYNFPKCEEFSL